MRAPRFWTKSGKYHPLALLLTPLSWGWAAASARRLKRGAWAQIPVPVVCVGNINAGGTGKTPTVIALAGFLADRGVVAHVVSRGYGGTATGPLRVSETAHTAAEVGDEPLLMAAFCPTWVAKDRASGARAAVKAGAKVILLDDGFQNPGLKKDLSLIVVDAEIGFGNGRVLPAGPLREPLKTGLTRGDAIVLIGPATAQARFHQNWPQAAALPCLPAALTPLKTGMDWQGARVVAFAGIGRPAKFFNTLKSEGAIIVGQHGFADHAPYSEAVLQRLLKESHRKNAQLVTTEKDAARLPVGFRPEVVSLPVRLAFADTASLETLLQQAGVLPL